MLVAFGYGDEGGTITMTTTSREVRFELKGSGTTTVDWGDGSEIKTVDFKDANEYGWVRWVHHKYSDTTPRTITIIGKNITGLNCTSSVPAQPTDPAELDNNIIGVICISCQNNQITALTGWRKK